MRPAAAVSDRRAFTAVAEAGFPAVELPAPPRDSTGDRLDEAELQLAAFVLPLEPGASRAAQQATLEGQLDLASASGARAATVALLLDATVDAERAAAAGEVEAHRHLWTRDARLGAIVDAAHRAAERARDRGLEVAFLPRPGTPIETPREVDSLAHALDPDLLGLALDVEGWLRAGGDPLAYAAELAELTRYVRLGEDTAVVAPLHAAGYDGWVTAAVGDDPAALAAARERLADAGLD